MCIIDEPITGGFGVSLEGSQEVVRVHKVVVQGDVKQETVEQEVDVNIRNRPTDQKSI